MGRLICGIGALLLVLTGPVSAAEPFAVGTDKCKKCHKAELAVWQGTQHFKSFKAIHKNKKAKKIVKAIGEKRMKKAAVRLSLPLYGSEKERRRQSEADCRTLVRELPWCSFGMGWHP